MQCIIEHRHAVVVRLPVPQHRAARRLPDVDLAGGGAAGAVDAVASGGDALHLLLAGASALVGDGGCVAQRPKSEFVLAERRRDQHIFADEAQRALLRRAVLLARQGKLRVRVDIPDADAVAITGRRADEKLHRRIEKVSAGEWTPGLLLSLMREMLIL
eukprot:SAG11_NODE_7162_length_1185_cov_0.836096_3_plen_159_part_00